MSPVAIPRRPGPQLRRSRDAHGRQPPAHSGRSPVLEPSWSRPRTRLQDDALPRAPRPRHRTVRLIHRICTGATLSDRPQSATPGRTPPRILDCPQYSANTFSTTGSADQATDLGYRLTYPCSTRTAPLDSHVAVAKIPKTSDVSIQLAGYKGEPSHERVISRTINREQASSPPPLDAGSALRTFRPLGPLRFTGSARVGEEP